MPVWRHSDGWSALAWMEKTMSKNKDISKTRELTEDELNHVSGGRGRAEVNHSEFTIVKLVDAATPKLF